MEKKYFSALILKLVISLFGFNTYADTALDLLTESDIGRGGIKDGIQWVAEIETHEDEEVSSREMLIKAKDHDAFVEVSKPAKSKGEVYLFNDRLMWYYKPSLKKPISISPRQKLTGQAAIGDIASTHYARDYNPTLEKTETLNGNKHHVLLLKAKADNMTYDQIRYWINDKNKLAVKAEFLTLQGKAFKIGYLEYDNSLNLKGKVYPFVSKLTIEDAKYPQNKSVIKYRRPEVKEFPKSLFNINNVSR